MQLEPFFATRMGLDPSQLQLCILSFEFTNWSLKSMGYGMLLVKTTDTKNGLVQIPRQTLFSLGLHSVATLANPIS